MDGVINERWRELMRFQVQRARAWFRRSEAGIRWLGKDARWPVWMSLQLYQGILRAIEGKWLRCLLPQGFRPASEKTADSTHLLCPRPILLNRCLLLIQQ